jgi:hypothetical protein
MEERRMRERGHGGGETEEMCRRGRRWMEIRVVGRRPFQILEAGRLSVAAWRITRLSVLLLFFEFFA